MATKDIHRITKYLSTKQNVPSEAKDCGKQGESDAAIVICCVPLTYLGESGLAYPSLGLLPEPAFRPLQTRHSEPTIDDWVKLTLESGFE